jgi:hypothetical protein
MFGLEFAYVFWLSVSMGREKERGRGAALKG